MSRRRALGASFAGRAASMRSTAAGAFVTAAALAFALGACQRSGDTSEGAPSPTLRRGTPVVLISIDTLRSDRLPAYGYHGIETPAIDRLRADAVLFERAYCHMSLTLPSHVSIFTGLRPDQSGVRDNVGYRLAAGAPTLPVLLREHGYATGGAVSSYVLRRATGLAAGFDFYDDEIVALSGVELGGLQRPGTETLARALGWLDSESADERRRPPFLFFHVYEPHSPYTPSEPFASRYADPYDAEVAEADAVIGQLIAELERRGLYDQALVILLSDHGEGLMDHGEMEHEVLLYREMLQVPLLVKLPGRERAGEAIATPAQLVDVMPTVLELLGIPTPPGLPGANLFGLSRTTEGGQRQILAESVYPRLHFGWSDLASLIEGPHHLIAGPGLELYDLLEDPREQDDLAAQQPEVVARLRRSLLSWDRTIAAPGAVDEETRRQLQALGYAAASAGASLEGARDLADPRTKVHLLEVLGEAARLTVAGRHLEATAALERLTLEEPRMVYAWEQLARSRRHAGQTAAAREALERAYELSAGAPQVALSLAELELAEGRLEEAEAHALQALPSHESAADLLAQVALRRGDLAGAERRLGAAVETRGTRVEPLVTLTELRVLQRRYEDALVVSAQALSEFGERKDREVLRGLHYQRGLALAALERPRDAIVALQQEIALSPEELAPYPRLAFLYTVTGEPAQAGLALRRMVERNPRPAAYAEAVRALRALGDPASAEQLLRSARTRWPADAELRSLGGG